MRGICQLPSFMRTVSAFGLAALTLLLTSAARCGGPDVSELRDGEVVDSAAYQVIDYELTSEKYRKWLAASAALDSANIQPATRLDPRHATDDEIERTVDALEDDSLARAAIESADISVKDYVLTSVALAQTWDAVDRPTAVTGLRAENVAFLREQERTDVSSRPVTRPRARIIQDASDSDSDKVDSDADSDSDSNRGKAKGKGKGKKKG